MVIFRFAKLFLISFAYYCEVGEAASALCTECRIESGNLAVDTAILIGTLAKQLH